MKAKPFVLTAEPIDMTVIAKLRADYGDEDGTLLVGLIEAFVDETRAMQQAAQVPATGEHGVLLSKAAHRLKSAAATLGAKQVVSLCLAIEAAERAGDRTSASDAAASLMPAIVRARAVLKRVANAAQAVPRA
jgi:HPt (histidine-containing phosphotransfer) domain-containing protein